MNQPLPTKRERRAVILELLEGSPISSQADLAALLSKRGFEVNQATLSRDLRDMGVLKGAGGYRLPETQYAGAGGGLANLTLAVRSWLLSAVVAQNQVVLKTPPSGAQPLALALDQSEIESILGTLGGDDTILVITPDSKSAIALAAYLNRLAGHGAES